MLITEIIQGHCRKSNKNKIKNLKSFFSPAETTTTSLYFLGDLEVKFLNIMLKVALHNPSPLYLFYSPSIKDEIFRGFV